MGLKARLSSSCTKRSNNGVNLVTSRKINTRLARPIECVFRLCIVARYTTRPDRPYTYPKELGGGGGKVGDLTITWKVS